MIKCLNILYDFSSNSVHVSSGVCVIEDNLEELVLSFYHVGSSDETQVTRLGNFIR